MIGTTVIHKQTEEKFIILDKADAQGRTYYVGESLSTGDIQLLNPIMLRRKEANYQVKQVQQAECFQLMRTFAASIHMAKMNNANKATIDFRSSMPAELYEVFSKLGYKITFYYNSLDDKTTISWENE